MKCCWTRQGQRCSYWEQREKKRREGENKRISQELRFASCGELLPPLWTSRKCQKFTPAFSAFAKLTPSKDNDLIWSQARWQIEAGPVNSRSVTNFLLEPPEFTTDLGQDVLEHDLLTTYHYIYKRIQKDPPRKKHKQYTHVHTWTVLNGCGPSIFLQLW